MKKIILGLAILSLTSIASADVSIVNNSTNALAIGGTLVIDGEGMGMDGSIGLSNSEYAIAGSVAVVGETSGDVNIVNEASGSLAMGNAVAGSVVVVAQ